eukprot:1188677-Prorocentrum_minimum.AAC.4
MNSARQLCNCPPDAPGRSLTNHLPSHTRNTRADKRRQNLLNLAVCDSVTWATFGTNAPGSCTLDTTRPSSNSRIRPGYPGSERLTSRRTLTRLMVTG